MRSQTTPRQPSAAETTLAAGSTVLLGIAASLITLLAFAGIAFYLERGPVAAIDHQALYAAYQLRVNQSWLDGPMHAATWLGAVLGLTLQTIAGLLLIIWRKAERWRQDAVLLLMAICGAALLNLLLKSQFERPRPDLYPGPFSLASFSFPSGHSMSSAAFYGGLAWIAARHIRSAGRRLGIALLAALVTAWIGVSRMYFSVHYPSDVLGGFAAGVAWLLTIEAASRFWRWRLRRRGESSPSDPGWSAPAGS